MASLLSGIWYIFLLSLLIALSEQSKIDNKNKTSIADPATKLLNQFSKLPEKSHLSIYYNDKIILAVARENSTQNIKSQVTFEEYDKFLDIPIIQCGFQYIEKNENVTDVIQQLQKQWQLVTVQLDRPFHYSLMNDELKKCRSVDAVDSNKIEDIKMLNLADYFETIFNIYPGTKWCGKGDIASGFHDLGKFKKTDTCCRDHDLCSHSISRNEKNFNSYNSNEFSMSKCDCDYNLYKCLKEANTQISDNIIYTYFTLASTCIDFKKV